MKSRRSWSFCAREAEYWYEVDHNAGRSAHLCYAEDGTFAIGDTVFSGREQIAGFYRWRAELGARTARHAAYRDSPPRRPRAIRIHRLGEHRSRERGRGACGARWAGLRSGRIRLTPRDRLRAASTTAPLVGASLFSLRVAHQSVNSSSHICQMRSTPWLVPAAPWLNFIISRFSAGSRYSIGAPNESVWSRRRALTSV